MEWLGFYVSEEERMVIGGLDWIEVLGMNGEKFMLYDILILMRL